MRGSLNQSEFDQTLVQIAELFARSVVGLRGGQESSLSAGGLWMKLQKYAINHPNCTFGSETVNFINLSISKYLSRY